jgi:hypothetical protein
MPRYNLTKTIYAYGIIAVLSFLSFAAPAGAVSCDPGDLLVGEDFRHIYCARVIKDQKIIYDLVKENAELAKAEALTGQEWEIRKNLIDAAGNLAKSAREYEFGGKAQITCGGKTTYVCVGKEKCYTDKEGIDCSGLAVYSLELGACFGHGFVNGVIKASAPQVAEKLRGLETDAKGQVQFFKEHHAFIPSNGEPLPGDLVFYQKALNTGALKYDHVAIYLGQLEGGSIRYIIEATRYDIRDANGDVKKHVEGLFIWEEEQKLRARVGGYGNTSLLINNLMKETP